MKVKDYTDGYLKERWFVIQRREAAGLGVDPEDKREIEAEMEKRGFLK